VNLTNQADTAAYDFVVEAPEGNWNGPSGEQWLAPPEPAQVDLYLAPGQTRDVRIPICTNTPKPAGAEDYTTLAGLTFRWRWDL